jgi:multiple sugar transport system permease protein
LGKTTKFRAFFEPFAFLAPFMIGLLLFTVYPFINVFVLSFKENYKLSGTFSSFGFQNYADVLRDPNFLNGLKNTGLYVLFVVPIATVLSLFIANALNHDIKLKGVFSDQLLFADGYFHYRGRSCLEMAVQL